MAYESIAKLVKSCGLIFALAIGLGVPASFAILDYLRLQERVQSEADFHAATLARLVAGDVVNLTPHGARVVFPSTTDGTGRVRLDDATKTELATWGASIERSMTAEAPVVVDGVRLATVEVARPLGSLVGIVGSSVIIAALLLGITYISVCAIPVQALNEASREIASSRKHIEDKNAQLDAALANMVQGLCLYDATQRIVVANARYAEIYNLPAEAIKPGTTLEEVLRARVDAAAYDEYVARDIVEQGLTKFNDHVTEIVTLQDGRHISVVRRPLPNGGLISTHEDVTERKKADAIIAHMAMHDTLTGLPNRSMLQDRLEKALARVEKSNGTALLCLDLDRFKAVNDTLGHPVGDALLKSVGQRLLGCVRDTDTVARLGGDEFAVVQTGVRAPDEVAALARRIIDQMNQPFNIDGHRVSIGASVGIALAPMDGQSGQSLLKAADLALYYSKSTGRGRYHFFERDMDAHIQARRQMELDLQNALGLQQFELHYQPLIDLKSSSVVAMEALLRWKHPARGNVGPAEFIPLMEEIGLIQEVGLWVIQEACREAATWPDDICVSVNLSAHQFKTPTLALDIAHALGTSGLAAERLELEITESALMQNTESTLEILKQIRGLGVRIAMDDFGTGYSSLSYLHAFPFDKIKIDKCFVQSLSDRAESAHIMKAVVDLGANLHMVTTAEGVETREQLDRLRADGCSQVQGYYFSPPLPARELPGMFRRIGKAMAS